MRLAPFRQWGVPTPPPFLAQTTVAPSGTVDWSPTANPKPQLSYSYRSNGSDQPAKPINPSQRKRGLNPPCPETSQLSQIRVCMMCQRGNPACA
ncbi:hypothetical protein UPYG_G00200740 [Umbra pygmaea]|uniref:Uncharacterized protein n=1 Tax=Umbra pygmaea TaxID=75934 RepID=A0ABD0X609_UMBPY